MFRNLLILLGALIFLCPSTALVVVAMLGNIAAFAACTGGSLTVGPIPDSLTATTLQGDTITLNKQQLTHAATIITVGSHTEGAGRAGAGRAGVVIALMAALTESTLRMLANTGTSPESANYPNDGNGSDHDSLGLFQMRPQSGWGTVADLMNPQYQARAFFGGPRGPNYPSPRGLLDIPNWQQLNPGEAAQVVEVSAYPDRYQNFQPVAETILTTLTPPNGDSSGGKPVVPETTRIVFPLPGGSWVRSDPFGWRTDPISGKQAFHSGSDFAAPDGTPILALADGRVTVARFSGSYGGLIIIEHTVAGQRVASYYAHMWDYGIHVTPGQTVTAGQHIGDVGSAGKSTGPHLHLELHSGGEGQPAINADAWLTAHHAEGIPGGHTARATCSARSVG
jgi:murein DD-endopeptidase MepM/ murein hydrolase activator NlpD